MRRNLFAVVLILGWLECSVLLMAHHGAASFEAKEMTVKGTVTEWIWSNPHCFLRFDAKDSTGTVRRWTVETGNPTDISRQGFRRSSFKAGAEVTVTLLPVKTGEPVGRMRSVVLADGSTLPVRADGAAGAPQPPPAN